MYRTFEGSCQLVLSSLDSARVIATTSRQIRTQTWRRSIRLVVRTNFLFGLELVQSSRLRLFLEAKGI